MMWTGDSSDDKETGEATRSSKIWTGGNRTNEHMMDRRVLY